MCAEPRGGLENIDPAAVTNRHMTTQFGTRYCGGSLRIFVSEPKSELPEAEIWSSILSIRFPRAGVRASIKYGLPYDLAAAVVLHRNCESFRDLASHLHPSGDPGGMFQVNSGWPSFPSLFAGEGSSFKRQAVD